jgi:hypothetical protein
MRVALCLSGQPRWFLECSEYFKMNVIESIGCVDIFVHAWFDGQRYETSLPELPSSYPVAETPHVISEVYRPKRMMVEKPICFVDNSTYNFPKSLSLPNNVYSMFYSTKACIDLVKEIESEESFEYDWVFRSRFDYAINKRFDCDILNLLENNTFYSPHVVHHESNPHCHADFNFGCSKTMKAYSQTFNHLRSYNQEGLVLSNEGMTYKHIMNSQLNIKEFSLNNQFPPSQYAACWHSLWGHR